MAAMIASSASIFRGRLAQAGPVLLAGAHNGLSGLLVERAGFDGIWASGFEISASFGVPDASILTMTDYLTVTRAIRAVTRLPVIADCDNGFGNASNVMHAVRQYEAAGVAGICIEDNAFPKRCSLYPGGRRLLESVDEFAGKIRAAKAARCDSDFCIIARTEALVAELGVAEALERAHAYADSGADICLIHSRSSGPEEVMSFAREWKRDTPLACVPTAYAHTSAEQLHAGGCQVVVLAGWAVRASAHAMRQALGDLRGRGIAAGIQSQVATLQDIQELIGVERFDAAEREFLPRDDVQRRQP
jgi:phosphoenolpyruvate phosphomutase